MIGICLIALGVFIGYVLMHPGRRNKFAESLSLKDEQEEEQETNQRK